MMKGKINMYGFLAVERAGSMNKQGCPHGSGAENCGDWCPLFGEPEAETKLAHAMLGQQEGSCIIQVGEMSEPTGRTLLQLCKRTLTFDEFKDERLGSVHDGEADNE